MSQQFAPNLPLCHLPVAPVALIAALAFEARLPGLIDVRVGRDNSVLIEVIVAEPFTADTLLGIAAVLGCPPEEVEVTPFNTAADALMVYAHTSSFDFSSSFAAQRAVVCQPINDVALVGTEDSEESIQASGAMYEILAAQETARRQRS